MKYILKISTAGRLIHSAPHYQLLVNNKWLRASDIQIGDLLGVPRKVPFGATTVPDAWVDFLSIWLAEGSKARISNGDEQILDVFSKALNFFNNRLRHISNYDYIFKRKDGLGRKLGNPAIEWLREQDLYDKDSKTKFIPEWVFKLPESQLSRFLNLFFATDGCISKEGRLEIQLANEHMVRQLAELLLRFAIRGSIYKKIHKKLNKNGQPFVSWRWVTKRPDAVITFADRIGALTKEKAVEKARAMSAASRGNCNEYLPILYDDFVEKLEYMPEDKGKFGGYNATHDRAMPTELRIELNGWRKQTKTRMSVKRYCKMRNWVNGCFDNLLEGDFAWEEVKKIEKVASSHD